MIFLHGCTRMKDFLVRMRVHGWGRLFTAERPKPFPGEPWALDNGVFGAWRAKRPWSVGHFESALNQMDRGLRSGRLHRPLFVALPDRVADPSSLDYSMTWWMSQGKFYDVPWYLVLQNGMRPQDVAKALRVTIRNKAFYGDSAPRRIRGLFLGGDDAFKLTAPAWCRFAHDHGVAFHFAKVSTIARLETALRIGSDSADSTQWIRQEKLFDKFEQAWDRLVGPPGAATRGRDVGLWRAHVRSGPVWSRGAIAPSWGRLGRL